MATYNSFDGSVNSGRSLPAADARSVLGRESIVLDPATETALNCPQGASEALIHVIGGNIASAIAGPIDVDAGLCNRSNDGDYVRLTSPSEIVNFRALSMTPSATVRIYVEYFS